jgi:serine phosphatase RsbU (regulator of sigma subunit)/anti-sigma regulatory factor (Ser/Thr protein kinase)
VSAPGTPNPAASSPAAAVGLDEDELMRLTAEIGRGLISRGTIGVRLERCADALMRTLGFGAVMVWVAESGAGQVLLIAGRDRTGPLADIPEVQPSTSLVGRLVATVGPARSPSDRDDVVGAWAAARGYDDLWSWPLAIADRPVGVLVALAERPLPEPVVAVTAVLAADIAAALDRDWAYEELLRAVTRDERRRSTLAKAAAQAQALQELTSALSAAVTFEDVAHVVLEQARVPVGARFSSLAIVSDDRSTLHLFHRTGGGTGDAGWRDISLGARMPMTDAARSGQLVVLENREAIREQYPELADGIEQAGLAATAIAPIRAANGQVAAALGFAWDSPHELGRDEAVVMRTVTILCRQALDRARLYDAEQQSRERLQRLQELTALLSRAVTLDDVLDVIADDGIRLLGADRTRVMLPNATRTALDVVRSEDTVTARVSTPVDAPAVSAEAFRSGELVWITSPEELAERFPTSSLATADLTFQAIGAVPLVSDGEVLGVWALGFVRPVLLTDERQRLALLFGEQAAQALRRAYHNAADALARQRAEGRQEVVARLSQALTTADVAEALAEGATSTFGADRALVMLKDRDQPGWLSVAGQWNYPPAALDAWQSIPLSAPTPAAEVLRTGRPFFARTGAELEQRWPDLEPWWRQSGAASCAVIPLRFGGDTEGILWLGFDAPTDLTVADRVAISGLAAEAGQALARARRFDLEREVAITLQRSLLDRRLPDHPLVEVAVRYQASTEGIEVGGDFYDIVARADGSLALVVGDVVGHGIQAAATMGQLRSATDALIRSGHGPAQLLAQLDEITEALPDARLSTMACVIVEPGGESARYAVAGHPPPMVRLPDGTTSALNEARGTPLGVPGDGARTEASIALASGTTLFLYTDGLVERRGETIDDGIARLAAAVERHLEYAAPATCDLVVSAAMEGEPQNDDIALVAASRLRAPRFSSQVPGHSAGLSQGRADFRGWLTAVAVPEDERDDILLAFGEAVANAVEHGHRESGRPIQVSARLEGVDMLTVTVRDEGSWRGRSTPTDPHRGRGLGIMRALMHVQIETDERGTVIVMRRRLGGPARRAAAQAGET